ncbi:MAG: ATP-binding protein [Phycisphaerae bacterium]|nr:ATP-binding protein [Phycisphaerae bacterium]
MKTRELFQIDLPSNPERLPAFREELRAWLVHQPWDEHQLCDIILAVDEALTNVIRHGYKNQSDQPIYFTAMALNGDGEPPGIEIRIRDYGQQVDLSKIAGRDLGDIRPGGLGVHLIRAMMSSADYFHAPGGGLLLIMRKSLNHTGRSQE